VEGGTAVARAAAQSGGSADSVVGGYAVPGPMASPGRRAMAPRGVIVTRRRRGRQDGTEEVGRAYEQDRAYELCASSV